MKCAIQQYKNACFGIFKLFFMLVLVSFFSNSFAGEKILILPSRNPNIRNFRVTNRKNKIIIQCNLVIEKGVQYAELQRSKDGRYFKTIDRIEKVNKLKKLLDYSFFDSDITGGKYFYRIRWKYKDGRSNTSEVKQGVIPVPKEIELFEHDLQSYNVASMNIKSDTLPGRVSLPSV